MLLLLLQLFVPLDFCRSLFFVLFVFNCMWLLRSFLYPLIVSPRGGKLLLGEIVRVVFLLTRLRCSAPADHALSVWVEIQNGVAEGATGIIVVAAVAAV